MTRDLGALVAHLYFPIEHRLRIRNTNLLERTFGESRRRVKVMGRLQGEAASRWSGPSSIAPAAAGAASR